MFAERLFVLGLVLAATLLLIQLWRIYLAHRLHRLAEVEPPQEVERLLPAGPALLYFTGEECAQCHFQQEPILAQLAATTQTPIHTFDAVANDQLARFFGILTVPTTIWLDQGRRPAVINHGLATLNQLRRQAADLGVS